MQSEDLELIAVKINELKNSIKSGSITDNKVIFIMVEDIQLLAKEKEVPILITVEEFTVFLENNEIDLPNDDYEEESEEYQDQDSEDYEADQNNEEDED
jgi:hypothetical protein